MSKFKMIALSIQRKSTKNAGKIGAERGENKRTNTEKTNREKNDERGESAKSENNEQKKVR